MRPCASQPPQVRTCVSFKCVYRSSHYIGNRLLQSNCAITNHVHMSPEHVRIGGWVVGMCCLSTIAHFAERLVGLHAAVVSWRLLPSERLADVPALSGGKLLRRRSASVHSGAQRLHLNIANLAGSPFVMIVCCCCCCRCCCLLFTPGSYVPSAGASAWMSCPSSKHPGAIFCYDGKFREAEPLHCLKSPLSALQASTTWPRWREEMASGFRMDWEQMCDSQEPMQSQLIVRETSSWLTRRPFAKYLHLDM